MRMPKRGEKGFTLIELLIVVAILGVLAAVVIPNVGRFIGAGETEAQNTELSNIQAAVTAMMVDNELSALPAGTFVLEAARTQTMSAFPSSAVCAAVGGKLLDPDGVAYVDLVDPLGDKDGYILYQHDISAGDAQVAADLVNYVASATTAYWYWADVQGTVYQLTTAP